MITISSSNIIVVDSIMGGGKTSWCINEILNKNQEENILYITPYLDEVKRIIDSTNRNMFEPENKGSGKLDNISELLNNQLDIASTHALFQKFDDNCKKALASNEYTLILDETLNAVEPYQFGDKDSTDDYLYLLEHKDIKVLPNGLIEWIGSDLDTRYNDVRILAKNHCIFKVDDNFFLWHFPHEIFTLFKRVYVLTYMFEGSLMKYYFDLYKLDYELKSITNIGDNYALGDYCKPDKSTIKERIAIYNGKLNHNISEKDTAFSKSWFNSSYHKKDIEQLKNNLINFTKNIIKTNSKEIMWSTYQSVRKRLKAKGYANSFVACNIRATNAYSNAICLMYCVNWYVNPEIMKFLAQNNITIDQEKIALSTLLQWIWRSNIRVKDSTQVIDIYIPSKRMRGLLTQWLNE